MRCGNSRSCMARNQCIVKPSTSVTRVNEGSALADYTEDRENKKGVVHVIRAIPVGIRRIHFTYEDPVARTATAELITRVTCCLSSAVNHSF